ncbi:tRNA (adenosine(37)-N6)-threonylcarbamoyltransferase complex dimerization subunit type 1 TsaB [Sulfuriroseicoccus oceanibius]|uniref:tRNA (Adenosine(37)-N6)-threonylcarbamoyltransferase complex dimerization subunit type 1 TsaB n=1 Tax=Sulfuriroseicoccus oceanibius TaxID=2707525 RepID=A0A6B3LGZ2_9BACT|nr:tRNA (adenosine(37)-N6)-threonylcarbamoyltransferase complex dimerization subunit type 1 TsaB [Sulfuriroseicoccus oceanibius]QQL45348.1 tRNA (adenosine(37)-N6)-threonylcarbamoyltransferase complex dimerization subunit type 1 TsaB [Sulfuriroseicoccus oceanibius]
MTNPSRMLLVIDTSTTRGCVALVNAADPAALEVVAQHEFQSERSHNSQIFAPLGALLEALGTAPLDRIVVATGPGSYTGIRIGIAAANGIAAARSCPVIGVPSVLGLGDPAVNDFHVIGDARRGSAFHWEVKEGATVGGTEMFPVEQLDERRLDWSGPLLTLDPKPLAEGIHPALPEVTTLVSRFLANESAYPTDLAVEPVYLGAPFVTTAKK